MVIAIISDTHMPRGHRRLPAGCIERLRTSDLIIHAGDLIGVPVLRQLQALGPLEAVHGNVDDAEVRSMLPAQRLVVAGGARIAVIHDGGPAAGRLARMRRRFPDVDAVIFGHSHMPLRERSAEGFQIFNPGSPTERRRSPRQTMGLGRVKAGALTFELISLD